MPRAHAEINSGSFCACVHFDVRARVQKPRTSAVSHFLAKMRLLHSFLDTVVLGPQVISLSYFCPFEKLLLLLKVKQDMYFV